MFRRDIKGILTFKALLLILTIYVTLVDMGMAGAFARKSREKIQGMI